MLVVVVSIQLVKNPILMHQCRLHLFYLLQVEAEVEWVVSLPSHQGYVIVYFVFYDVCIMYNISFVIVLVAETVSIWNNYIYFNYIKLI